MEFSKRYFAFIEALKRHLGRPFHFCNGWVKWLCYLCRSSIHFFFIYYRLQTVV